MEQTSADFNLNELGRVESGFACLGQSGPGGATETLAAAARHPASSLRLWGRVPASYGQTVVTLRSLMFRSSGVSVMR